MRITFAIIIAATLALDSAQGAPLPIAQNPDIVLAPPVPPVTTATPEPVQKKLVLPDQAFPAITIRGVHVIGAKVISESVIARLFDPLVGKTASAAELRAVLDAVNRLYSDAGFALGSAYIPAQEPADGILTVQVLEGYVGAVAVQTDAPRVKDTVARYAGRIMASRPLRIADLDRYLRLTAGIPGTKLKATLTNIDPQTGAAVLVLEADYQPFTADLALDTHANVRGLPVQPYLSLRANDLFGQADQFMLLGLLSPRPKDNYFVQFGASTALGSDGWRLSSNTHWAKARTDGAPASSDLDTTLFNSELGFEYPLVKSASHQLILSGGGYFSRAGYEFNHAAIAWDRYAAGYAQIADVREISPELSQTASMRVTTGFTLPYDGGLPRSRINATGDFAKLEANGALLYTPVAKFGLLLRANAQVASGSLMAAEEIGYGGNSFGRGYDNGTISGDHGLGLTIQPQYSFTLAPDWSAAAYVFGDFARAFNTMGDGQRDATLLSSGIGFGIAHGDYGLDLTVAEPLRAVGAYYRSRTPRVSGTLQLKL